MNWRILIAILVSCFALGFTATPASAQATRTWVSGVGDDVNPCSRTAPCKTFAGAISKTAAGGEINCLDPAGFGAVTITKSITIDCQGTLGGILASSTTGVIVNGANVVVILRNLSINGGPPNLPGVNGIRILNAAQVNVENVRIFNFRSAAPNGFGIIVNPTAGAIRVYVTDTIISNNGTATSGGGINVVPTGAASVNLFLNRVDVNSHFQGVVFNTSGTSSGASSLAIQDSVLFRNSSSGLQLTTLANGLPVMLNDVTIDGNGNGIVMNGAGLSVRLGSSVLSFNGTAISNTGGSILSYKDNQIDSNGANNTPINPAGPQ